MCESLADGGRRCPCDEYGQRNNSPVAWRIRQRRSRAHRAVHAALAAEDKAAAVAAQRRLDMIPRALNAHPCPVCIGAGLVVQDPLSDARS